MNPNSLKTIQSDLVQGKYTIRRVVENYLEKIDQCSDLNVYVEVYAEEALEKAERLDKKLNAKDQMGSLFGCVISVKDNIVQKGKLTSAASKILEGYRSPFTATALQKLLDEDVIVIGRTNCDEFGMGSSNENSIYGPVKNGADPERTPGGSSGGAAVSVQMNTCLAALGSDTGGSIRQPASFCGVYGLKPSYGRVSRYGLIAYASSFDQIGVLGHNPEDIGAILDKISGHDPLDATSSSFEIVNNSSDHSIRNPKVAYFPQMVDHPKLDSDIKKAIKGILSKLEATSGKVEKMDFHYMEYLVPTYYVLTTAEASTNLSRYDGVRYGYRSPDSKTLDEMYVNSRTQGFGKEVKRRIMLGTYVLSEGYFDAYFTKAQKLRKLIKEEIDQILQKVDFIILPTSNSLPWQIGEHQNDPVAEYLSDIYTVLANLTGLPAISIPMGTNSDGIPLGIQIITKKYDEKKLLQFSESLI